MGAKHSTNRRPEKGRLEDRAIGSKSAYKCMNSNLGDSAIDPPAVGEYVEGIGETPSLFHAVGRYPWPATQ